MSEITPMEYNSAYVDELLGTPYDERGGAWVDEVVAQLVACRAEHDKQLTGDMERAAIHLADMWVYVHDLKSSAEAFVRGAGLTPWHANEPRVVGYKKEFDALVAMLAKPEPVLPPCGHQ